MLQKEGKMSVEVLENLKTIIEYDSEGTASWGKNGTEKRLKEVKLDGFI